MKLVFAVSVLIGCLLGCGSPAQPEATKSDFAKAPRPAGFTGPATAGPSAKPPTGG